MAKRPRHAPLAGDPRKFKRNLTQAFREGISSDTLFRYLMAIMQGKDALITEDARTEDGWNVTWPEHGLPPDIKTRNWAVEKIMQYRDGLPVQQIALDAEMRTLHLAVGAGEAGEALLALPADTRARILEEMTRAMLNAGQAQPQATDAEFIDVPELPPGDPEPEPE